MSCCVARPTPLRSRRRRAVHLSMVRLPPPCADADVAAQHDRCATSTPVRRPEHRAPAETRYIRLHYAASSRHAQPASCPRLLELTRLARSGRASLVERRPIFLAQAASERRVTSNSGGATPRTEHYQLEGGVAGAGAFRGHAPTQPGPGSLPLTPAVLKLEPHRGGGGLEAAALPAGAPALDAARLAAGLPTRAAAAAVALAGSLAGSPLAQGCRHCLGNGALQFVRWREDRVERGATAAGSAASGGAGSRARAGHAGHAVRVAVHACPCCRSRWDVVDEPCGGPGGPGEPGGGGSTSTRAGRSPTQRRTVFGPFAEHFALTQ